MVDLENGIVGQPTLRRKHAFKLGKIMYPRGDLPSKICCGACKYKRNLKNRFAIIICQLFYLFALQQFERLGRQADGNTNQQHFLIFIYYFIRTYQNVLVESLAVFLLVFILDLHHVDLRAAHHDAGQDLPSVARALYASNTKYIQLCNCSLAYRLHTPCSGEWSRYKNLKRIYLHCQVEFFSEVSRFASSTFDQQRQKRRNDSLIKVG